jgi:gluconate 5-dehydrogenase
MGLLTNKTVLVAGASRGIGLAIATNMAAEGGKVILASRSITALEEAASRLQGVALELDLMQDDSITRAADAAGEVDVLVNVAGMNIRKAFEDFSREEMETILQTNLVGLMRLTQLVGKGMIARKRGGKIINIGGLVSLIGIPYISVYGASKGAIGQWSRCLAAEWGRYNIQVNCIAPGFILTDLNRKMWQEENLLNWLKASQPCPRLGTPEDVSPLAVYLASSQSDYVTGQIITVDGGHAATAMWPFTPGG